MIDTKIYYSINYYIHKFLLVNRCQMMQLDESIKILVSAAYQDKNDVFLQCTVTDFSELLFDDVKSVLILPGAVAVGDTFDFISDEIGCRYDVFSDGGSIVADVRALDCEAFRAYMSDNNFFRIVIPFAECALASEYGHRREYLWTREYRAEIKHFCQLVAIFSPAFGDAKDGLDLYSDGPAVFAGEKALPDMTVYECSTSASKFYYTANELEKTAFGKHVVFFNSRNEAAQFSCFLQKRGSRFIYVDGSSDSTKLHSELKSFTMGDTDILITTKSGISLMPFISVDKVILCGVPFSAAHLGRISSACRSGCVKIICSPSDGIRNMRILSYFKEKDEDEELYLKRIEKLSEISEIVINKE